MNKWRITTWLAWLLLFLFLWSAPVHADESSVAIDTVNQAQQGEEVTIKLHVSHEGNNFIHYTYRVYLSINGEIAKEWKFGIFDRPSEENFTKEITYTADQSLDLEAKAFCTLHGSNNTARTTISVD